YFLYTTPPSTNIYTLSLHDALPIYFQKVLSDKWPSATDGANGWRAGSSEKAAGISTALEPSRTQDGHGLQHAQTDSSFARVEGRDRKSTRLNSSHVAISYAVFCLKK